ncbi:MAG: hypothetical protein KDI38_06105, partial [Calditrichaeota bacterium]|nr:hypothetical protein [Calditrichota bacterium]
MGNLDAGCWMLDAGCWMLDVGKTDNRVALPSTFSINIFFILYPLSFILYPSCFIQHPVSSIVSAANQHPITKRQSKRTHNDTHKLLFQH